VANERQKAWNHAHPQERRINEDRYRARHPERVAAAAARYYVDHREGALESIKLSGKTMREIQRVSALMYYSGGTMTCACCGEGTYEFLAIDHVNGGGSQHRKTVKGHVVRDICRNDFPDGYQVLCHNCNMAKGFYGQCPHQGGQSDA
jgi:hypothetical protein